MTTFLNQFPWISRFEYMWSLPVMTRSIMMSDVTRPDYSSSKRKRKDKEIKTDKPVVENNEKSLGDFLMGK